MIQKNHVVVVGARDEDVPNSKSLAVCKCIVCIFITFLLVVNLLVVTRLNSMSQEIEALKIIVSGNLNSVSYKSDEENTYMKFADFDGYQENEDQLIPDNIEETENQSKNVEYFEMSSSQERENDTDDDTRNDTRVRKRRSTKKLASRSIDVFHNSDEEATYSPDFRERENSFEHHGSFKHKHLEVLTERHPRVGRIKPLPSAHFSGDTSRYILGQHPNFNGNGHLKHLQRMFMDWKPSEWAHHTGLDSHFQLNLGILTVKESGLYFIYSQIYYLDEHDIIGYKVFKNSDVILQCTITVHTTERRMKGNTCYTAGMEYLQEGDNISIENVYDGRYSLFEPGKSFFGVIKLGDIRIK